MKISVTEPTVSEYDKWDRSHSWHPFTQMQEYVELPQLHVERGEGSWLFDVSGNRYLDANASIWTNAHGHNDPELNQVLIEQLGKIAHSTYLGLSHPIGAKLSAKLAEISPDGLERIVYSDNGSCAIEIALKLSFQYWQLKGKSNKRLVLGMENGYHGDTFGTMSAGDSRDFHGRFAPWCFESLVFPAPVYLESSGVVVFQDDVESLGQLQDMLNKRSEEIACLVMEPLIQGPAGMQLQPEGFLKKISELCRRFDVHLILDEVFVGCGRTGRMFACESEGVTPDFLCLAKGLSAGYLPMAATLVQEGIYETFLGTFDSGMAFIHGHTFTGNPLAAAVSLKSIEKLEILLATDSFHRNLEYFASRLRDAFVGHSNVKEIRQRGFAAAIDLYPGKNSDVRWRVNDRMGLKVCVKAREHGVMLRPLLDSVLLVPPLIISREEIDFLISGLLAALSETL